MAKKKSVYVGYSEEDVRRMENGYYMLQFGGDAVVQDGAYAFTPKEVTKLYNSTFKRLLDLIEDGSEKDRKYALDLVAGLLVKPMRLH